MSERCLIDLDGNAGITLADVLSAARAPYERALTAQRQREEEDERARQVLGDDPEAMRRYITYHGHTLAPYMRALDRVGECAVELLKASTDLSPDEQGVLRAIARDLRDELPYLDAHRLPEPDAGVRGEVALLVEQYRVKQSRQLEALAERHGLGPHLRSARRLLEEGALLDRATLASLPADVDRDAASRREQHQRQQEYLTWRERAARQLARRTGPLGRLTDDPQNFYAQLDRQHLRVCGRCDQRIYPTLDALEGVGLSEPSSCHYCRQSYDAKPYDPTTRTEAYE